MKMHKPIARLILLLALATSGCQPMLTWLHPTPTPLPTPIAARPETTADAFLRAWERADYAAMYDLLAPSAKAQISLTDLQDKYRTSLSAAGVTSLRAQVRAALESGYNAQVDLTVTMQSALLGAIAFEQRMALTFEAGRWGILWSSELIFPGLTDQRRVHLIERTAVRGNIYDRDGLGLAAKGSWVTVGLVPGRLSGENEARTLDTLARILHMPVEEIRQAYADALPYWYVPLKDIPPEVSQANYETLTSLPGVELEEKEVRAYPAGSPAAHVVGYMGPIYQEELAEWQQKGYRGDELVGQTGLEAWGEPYLAGRRGGVLTLIDSHGNLVSTLAEQPATPARSLYTTLRRDFQQVAEALLAERGKPGAVVALDPRDGAILALASYPSYDLGQFVPAISADDWAKLDGDPQRPLVNRALQAAYPPGSVFKVVTLSAGLEGGNLNRDSHFTCHGAWSGLGPEWTKTCWLETGHGSIDVITGLTVSCDVVFYEIGLLLDTLDADILPTYARGFGLGQPTGLQELPESAGLVPDIAWKRAAYDEPWVPGDSVNLAIGQGFLLTTPLQIARMMAAVANGGALLRPQIVYRIGDEVVLQRREMGQLPVNVEHLAEIQEGLLGVGTLPYGTAYRAMQGLPFEVAGKTGTAESGDDEPHAWFVGYAPAQDPEIVIAVVVEYGGEGPTIAAPLFRKLVEAYFGIAPPETPTPVYTPTPSPAP
jgi:penicillin-binding protein 2